MANQETNIQNKIRLSVSENCPGIVFRLNSGKAWGGDKVIDTPEYGRVLLNPRPVALCPPGTSDLVYFGPAADTVFLEVKTDSGKTSDEQDRFIALMQKYGHSAAVVRSAEEAVRYINDPNRRRGNHA